MAQGKTQKSDSEMGDRVMWLVVLMVVALLLGLVAINLKGRQVYKPGKAVPPVGVGELFACGDYCPGPQEKYMKKVYTDVKSEQDCIALGGEWQSFVGWGTTYYCEVI